MKVIIDLIEDIRESIRNEAGFKLSAMGLHENENGEFTPLWKSNISTLRVDEQARKVFFFLGKEEGLNVGVLLERLNVLSNEAMMYELCISYTKEEQRADTPVMGFGESLEDKRYHLFISG